MQWVSPRALYQQHIDRKRRIISAVAYRPLELFAVFYTHIISAN